MKKIKILKIRQIYFLPIIYILSFAYAADTLKPDLTVKAISSVQGMDSRYLSVGVLPTLQLRFSESMNAATLTADNIRVVGVRDNSGSSRNSNISLNFSYDSATYILNITPQANLNWGWFYELVITQGVQDLAGNGLSAEKKVFFETLMAKGTINQFTASDGKTQVMIPSNALSEDASLNVSVVSGGIKNSGAPKGASALGKASFNGYNSLQYVLPSALEEANQKLRDVVGVFAQEVTVREFAAINQNGNRIRTRFNAPVTIVMPYLDEDSDGYIDGVTPQVKVKDLKVYLLDEVHNVWNRVSNAEIDSVNKKATMQVNHFSVYSVMGAPDGDVSSSHAFPVPFKASESSVIRFINLPSEGKIKIYTMTGELVTAVNFTITSGESIYDWNVKNSDGEEVASGVYAYIIESGSNKKTGKLVIIR